LAASAPVAADLLVHVGDNGLDELLVRFAARLAANHDTELQAIHAVELLPT
jgi:hypothetical protein